MFKRLLLALVCLIIFGFIYRLSFFKKHYKIEHFTTTAPTFNDILSDKFCDIATQKYLHGNCVTTKCPEEKCWELQQYANDMYTHVHKNTEMTLTTGTEQPYCEPKNASKCGDDKNQPICGDNFRCWGWEKNLNNEWTQPTPRPFGNTTTSFKENGTCPDRQELDATCPELQQPCPISSTENCFILSGSGADALNANNWNEYQVFNKRIDDNHRCREVIEQNTIFVTKPNDCMSTGDKNNHIQNVVNGIACGDENCWSKEPVNMDSVPGLPTGSYYYVTHRNAPESKNNLGECSSTCSTNEFKTVLDTCEGFSCKTLIHDPATNENVITQTSVASNLYSVQPGQSELSCPTRATLGCFEYADCPTVSEKCYIQKVTNPLSFDERDILFKRIGNPSGCEKVINTGNTSNPVYISFGSAGCKTEDEKTQIETDNLNCPDDYVGACWVPDNADHPKWVNKNISSRDGSCQFVSGVYLVSGDSQTDPLPKNICKNNDYINSNNYCRLEGIQRFGGAGEGGALPTPSEKHFKRICNYASNGNNKTLLSAWDEVAVAECNKVCVDDQIGTMIHDNRDYDCECVERQVTVTAAECNPELFEVLRDTTPPSCEKARNFHDCQGLNSDYIYDPTDIGEPCKITPNTLPGTQVITEVSRGPTSITISVQTPRGSDNYPSFKHKVYVRKSLSNPSTVLHEQIHQIKEYGITPVFTANDLESDTEYIFTSEITYIHKDTNTHHVDSAVLSLTTDYIEWGPTITHVEMKGDDRELTIHYIANIGHVADKISLTKSTNMTQVVTVILPKSEAGVDMFDDLPHEVHDTHVFTPSPRINNDVQYRLTMNREGGGPNGSTYPGTTVKFRVGNFKFIEDQPQETPNTLLVHFEKSHSNRGIMIKLKKKTDNEAEGGWIDARQTSGSVDYTGNIGIYTFDDLDPDTNYVVNLKESMGFGSQGGLFDIILTKEYTTAPIRILPNPSKITIGVVSETEISMTVESQGDGSYGDAILQVFGLPGVVDVRLVEGSNGTYIAENLEPNTTYQFYARKTYTLPEPFEIISEIVPAKTSEPQSYHWRACPPNEACGLDESGNELTCRNTSLSGATESKRCLTQGDAAWVCHEMEPKGSHGYNSRSGSDNCYSINTTTSAVSAVVNSFRLNFGGFR